MSSPAPTPDNITTVSDNLNVLIQMNNESQNSISNNITEAYLRFSDVDDSNAGLTVIINFVEGAFWAIGSEFGPGGNFVASFLSGMVSYWATAPPPDFKQQFAKFLDGFTVTSNEITAQLRALHGQINSTHQDEVLAAWNTKYTDPSGQETALSALASHKLPTPGMSDPPTPNYDQMKASLIRAHDQSLWKQVLVANYEAAQYVNYATHVTDKYSPPTVWMQQFYQANKCTYGIPNWKDYDRTQGQWMVLSYWVCLKNAREWWLLSDAACEHLFIDSTPGTIINTNGLYTRQEVVDFLGIIIPPGLQSSAQAVVEMEVPQNVSLALHGSKKSDE